MGAVLGNVLGAGAQAGGGHDDLEPQLGFAVVKLTDQRRLIVHQALDLGDGGLLHHEERKLHLDVTGLRVQLLGHLDEDVAERFDGDLTFVAMEQLDERRDMCVPLKLWGRATYMLKFGDGVLLAAGAVLHPRPGDRPS